MSCHRKTSQRSRLYAATCFRRGAIGGQTIVVCVVLGLLSLSFSFWMGQQSRDSDLDRDDAIGSRPSTNESDVPSAANRSDTNERFTTTIRQPLTTPRLDTLMTDAFGEPITVACSTCHQSRPPDATNQSSEDLDEFHVGLEVLHGDLTCLSCHNGEDYDSLKLSDQRRVAFSDVMELCAQCHGTQMRDYENGAHGGMKGFWDTTRGPRERNNCVDCHHPHAPKFPDMTRTFFPRDRFLGYMHQDGPNTHE